MSKNSVAGDFRARDSEGYLDKSPATMQTVAEEVGAQLLILHGPHSTPSDRRAAQTYLDGVKQSPDVFPIGLFLARPQKQLSLSFNGNPQDTAAAIRFFGLSLIEKVVKRNWNPSGCPPEETESVKAAAKELALECAANPNDVAFLRRKVASIFAEVAKRLWPQRWPEMDGILAQLHDQSLSGKSLALLIFKSLFDDVFVYDDPVADARKRDLSTALSAVVVSRKALEVLYLADRAPDASFASFLSEGDPGPAVVSLTLEGGAPIIAGVNDVLRWIRADPQMVGWLDRWMRLLVQLRDVLMMEPADPSTEAGAYQTLGVELLETIASLLAWVPLVAFRACDMNVVVTIALFCNSKIHSARMAATDCLVNIYDRADLASDEAFWTSIVDPTLSGDGCVLEVLASAWKSLYRCINWDNLLPIQREMPLPEPDYLVLKRIVQIFGLITEKQICSIKGSSPADLTRLLEVLLIMAEHPSTTILSTVYSAWLELLKHDYFCGANKGNCF
ncbi:armadillo-type protein [Zopfochytrium polystomum]|nr:armadillo-type protein [Zopfochytrium polystomum]